MSNELHELFGTIADEEKAAASAHIRGRIEAMTAQDDGPMRARIFAATTMIAGAELFAKLDSAGVHLRCRQAQRSSTIARLKLDALTSS